MVLISNMAIVFFKFQSKNAQKRHFWSQIQEFLFLQETLRFHKFQDGDLKYDNSFSFLVPSLKFLFSTTFYNLAN